MEKGFEVSWREINHKGEIVVKRAAFTDRDKRFRFCLGLEKRSGFLGVLGFRDPVVSPLVIMD